MRIAVLLAILVLGCGDPNLPDDSYITAEIVQPELHNRHEFYIMAELMQPELHINQPEFYTAEGLEWRRVEGPVMFWMGSPEDEVGRNPREETPREFTIEHTFVVSTTEVTQEVWGVEKPACKHCPITSVSWIEVTSWLDKLSADAGFTPCYSQNCGFVCDGYRLPTEAEWEYVARAGALDSRYGPLEDIAVRGQLVPVKSKRPNAWGLYDVIGNAEEWVEDYKTPSPNTLCADDSQMRVIKGGGFDSQDRHLRVANRSAMGETDRSPSVGFRVVRTLIEKGEN